jgi:glycosyltransferase involved in cell wall biosynthesis
MSELKRRAADSEVSSHIRRVGTSLELANVLLQRTRLPIKARRAMFRPRMIGFDRGVARRLSGDEGAVIGYQGAAVRMFRRARELGIPTVLDYPIAHFEVTERVLAEEARLVPEYAGTLQRYPSWLLKRYAEEIDRADRIIVLSNYQLSTFEEAGVDRDRMFIAPLGVDSTVFTPPDTEPDGPFRIAFSGQITQRKGISYLVEGFRRAAIPNSELLFIGVPIGPTPWLDVPGVKLVPAMARTQLPEVFRTCHVTALPSLIEGFGAAALEAMACGMPAIVTEHTFADDVISEGVDGWIIPLRDPDAIAERLRALHADPGLRARMGAAARAKAEQFPWERYCAAVRAGVAPLLDGSAR